MDTVELEQCIHHRFSQVKLLHLALTHSSYANEQGCEGNNERLEFLGDAVLELCISEEAYKRYPLVPEGHLTRIRSNLVKEKSLASIARGLGLDRYLLLGRGEDMQGGRERDSLLSDVFEAVIGAVFLDSGFENAKRVVAGIFSDRWPENTVMREAKDYKSRLQEETQRLFQARPVYVLTGTEGPEHEKVFEVRVTLPDESGFEASGTSVKKAEQNAARKALELLGTQKPGHQEPDGA
ncbi:ribonuclease III [Pseudodesulfovibrio senegalensis]|uniref:Ribonuclease 3 n=1 Tax=Pseudodesulfovibrio senegalensis TaxID=1721087 RepID=A0A6N6MZA2_9BACT|nr:ribonuclease III [Pseudodesulfovibrio senegalensis]KAB1438972.1 ribonuclease III [Pseudodesulfovibrio senegalensis]